MNKTFILLLLFANFTLNVFGTCIYECPDEAGILNNFKYFIFLNRLNKILI